MVQKLVWKPRKKPNKLQSFDLAEIQFFTHAGYKRLFDILFSLLVLIFLSPLFVILSLSIKLTSKGPVFYKSKCLGQNFRKIHCYKFRTMAVNADSYLETLLKKNPQLEMEWKKYHKLKKDPRITKIGKFLRKTSLDELPQFFNVLKGDLSVVGPRPYAIFGKEEAYLAKLSHIFGSRASVIFSIKPGVTGLWQTSGRSKLSIEDRIRMDAYYAKKNSFFYDLFLILKTIPIVILTRGAY